MHGGHHLEAYAGELSLPAGQELVCRRQLSRRVGQCVKQGSVI